MKNFFEFIGILTLVIGSFIYTNKIDTVSINSDTLMQEIKNKASEYKKLPVEAIINDNTIIPGKNGKQVNINKSYYNMKKIGYFDERELIYDIVYVKNKLENNKNKYIINGNNTIRNVTIIFNTNKEIETINRVLLKHNIKASYVADNIYLENNEQIVDTLVKSKYEFINNSNNQMNFIWFKTTLQSMGQKNTYCINPNNNKYKYCTLEKAFILKTDSVTNNYYINVKNNLSNGYIFYFKESKNLIKELDNIINYIENKGYKIVSLNKLLSE